MEAVALHDFTQKANDELSFRKKDVLKVLSKVNQNEPSWFKAEKDGREGYIPSNYVEFEPHPWYQGKITRREAEEFLLSNVTRQSDGAFLIRDSETAPGELSLSVKYQDKVQHFKVMRDQGQYYIWTDRFSSLNKLIEFHRYQSISTSQHITLRDFTPPSGPASVVPATSRVAMPAPITRQNGPPININGSGAVGKAPMMQPGVLFRARGLFKFSAENNEELSFVPNDVLDVLDTADPNWWEASLAGRRGLIPSNYVEKLPS